jgi:hypothetical protein
VRKRLGFVWKGLKELELLVAEISGNGDGTEVLALIWGRVVLVFGLIRTWVKRVAGIIIARPCDLLKIQKVGICLAADRSKTFLQDASGKRSDKCGSLDAVVHQVVRTSWSRICF